MRRLAEHIRRWNLPHAGRSFRQRDFTDLRGTSAQEPLHEPRDRSAEFIPRVACRSRNTRNKFRAPLESAVHGPNVRPKLEVEATHEPEAAFADFQRLRLFRFMAPTRVKSFEVFPLHEPGSAGTLAGALNAPKLAGKGAGAPRVHGRNALQNEWGTSHEPTY